MARGHYELPHVRPRPAYGPPRPPKSPPKSLLASDSTSSASSTSSWPTSPLSSFGTKAQADLAIVSLGKSERYGYEIETPNAKVDLSVNAEDISTVDGAASASVRSSSAIIFSEGTLRDPARKVNRSEAARYVQNGVVFVTDPSQVAYSPGVASQFKNLSLDTGSAFECRSGQELRDKL